MAGPDSIRRLTPPAWASLLVAGLTLIGVYYLMPRAGVAQAVIICAVNAWSAVVVFTAVRGQRGPSRWVWTSLALGVTFSTLANIPNYAYPLVTGRATPFPSLVDVPWLLMYPCFLVALGALLKIGRDRDQRGNLLDALIVIVGGGTFLWVFMFEPIVASTPLRSLAFVVSILFPIMDVVVFAMLVRLLMGSGSTVAMRLLTVSFVSLLLGDLTCSMALFHGIYQYGGPTDGFWMLSYLLVAVAACHPSAHHFPREPSAVDHRLNSGRLYFLGAALLVGPVLLATQHTDTMVLLVSSVVSFFLAMARVVWLNRQLMAASAAVAEKSEALRHQALHDALTGLPNRAMLMEVIADAVARARRNQIPTSVLYLDLDGFKQVNDALGHHVGDALLVESARRMSSVLREGDTVGRLGGDEFIFVPHGTSREGDAELIAQRLLDVLRAPFVMDQGGEPLRISASIGVTRGVAQAGGDLLREADVALYRAKADGRDCYRVFTGDRGAQHDHPHELPSPDGERGRAVSATP